MTLKPTTETEIFQAAVKLPIAERGVFLDSVCGNNQPLRREVDSLLKAHEVEGSFLDSPAMAVTVGMPNLEEPSAMIGSYKLREKIGEGGFGVVYVAEQERPIRRKVALKVIKPGMDSKDVIARFEAERQALAMMDHPHVARVLDAGTTEKGRPYFVMELVSGVTITEFCNTNRLGTRERVSLLADVGRAVQHAHQKGIIHRDLKPSNVMVTLHDGKPVVKVIDFGIAKALNQRITERTIYTAYGQMIGTPSYMSPEQAEMSGLGVDTRSDIYSLGVLAYELLTGQTPLDAKRLRESAYDEILRIIREEEPPRPSQRVSTLGEQAAGVALQRHTEPEQLRKSLAGEVDWIVMKCLEKDRSRRYETANALVRDIERYLQDEPIEACPPSLWYKVRKFSRKHRSLIATTAAFALLLLTATGVSSWLALHARNSSRLAQSETRKAKQSLEEETRQRELAASSAASAKAAQDRLRKSLYASKMNLVQSAWGRQQFGQVQSMLDSAVPSSSEPDLRGFEWYYWQRRLRNGITSIQKLQNEKQWGVVRYGSGGARVFWAAKEMPITDASGNPLDTEASHIHNVAVSVFDADDGMQLSEFSFEVDEKHYGFTNLQNEPFHIEFENLEVSDDAKRWAVYFDQDKSAHMAVFDTESGAEVMTTTLADGISGVNLSQDGSRVAAISNPRDAVDESGRCRGICYRVWDTATGNLLYEHSDPERSWDVHTTVLSPDGRKMSRTLELVNQPNRDSTQQGTIELVGIDSNEVLWTREFTNFQMQRHAWSPDGRWIAIRVTDDLSKHEYIQLLNPETGRTQAVLSHEVNANLDAAYHELVFSKDSKHVASFSENAIAIWTIPDVADPIVGELADKSTSARSLPEVTIAHVGSPLRGIAFSPDSAELLGVTLDSSVRWSLADLPKNEFTIPSSPTDAIVTSFDGTRLAVLSDGQDIAVWNTLEGSPVCELSQQYDRKTFGYPVFSRDSQRVLTFEPDSASPRNYQSKFHACIYDTNSGELIRRLDNTATRQQLMDLDRSGNFVAAVVDDPINVENQPATTSPQLQVWDVTSGEVIKSVILDWVKPGEAQCHFVTYILDGSEIGLVKSARPQNPETSYEFSIVVYDAQSLDYRRTVTCTPGIRIKLDRTRQSICEPLKNGDLLVRSLLNGERESQLPASHKEAGRYARTHDGTRIATLGPFISGSKYDSRQPLNELVIWNLETGDKLFSTTIEGVAPFVELAFTPEDKQLVIARPSSHGVSITILDAQMLE